LIARFAWRYFRAKKTTNAINIISWVTAGVIAFATMCQVLVLSVFNGFEDLVKSLYSNFYTDLRIVPANGKTLQFSEAQLSQLKAVAGVQEVSFVVQEKALLQSGESQTVVLLKGVDEDYDKVSGVPAKMQRGATFQIGSLEAPFLVLGSGIENALSIQSERALFPITVFLPKKASNGVVDPIEALSEGNANASGSFAIQQEFDNRYAITNIDFMKQQMHYGQNEYTAVEIDLTEDADMEDLKETLQSKFGENYILETKYEQNTSLYNSMRLEKWAIYAVLTLILIIAAFNMISALTMLVLEKQRDIVVLQSLGATKGLIQRIFLSEGLLLGAVGAGIGILLATIICLLQMKFKMIPLTGKSFLIDYFPVHLLARDFLLVAGTAILITFLAAWLPARKAARAAGSTSLRGL
jgi:lipoprotein-releasing system permease protein